MVANVKSKRVQWCLGLWWIGNVVKNGLQSTGAFEVFYDGHEIFRYAAPTLNAQKLLGP